MDLTEINSLIGVRTYIVNVINNSAFDRSVVNDLSRLLILIDKKIVSLLRTSEFKQYVGFEDAEKAIQEIVDLNNIKSGFSRR